jgi:hypothetical protein
VLPAITAPTLILHAARDRSVPIERAREMARSIPGARLVEHDSDVHLIWLSDVTDQIAGELEAFVAEFGAPRPRPLLTLASFATSPSADGAAVAAAVERYGGQLSTDRRRATFTAALPRCSGARSRSRVRRASGWGCTPASARCGAVW